MNKLGKLKQEMMDIGWQITCVMQANGMLELIDKYRNNQSITLSEIQKEWTEMYKVDASRHAFLNQHQYITSLLSFIAIPKEKLFSELSNQAN